MRSSRGLARADPRLAPGSIQQLADLHTTAVVCDVGAAQMIAQQVVGLPAGPHRDAVSACVVVLAHGRAVVALVDGAHVDGGRRAEGGLDPVAIPVIDEGSRGRAVDARQPVLGVVHEPSSVVDACINTSLMLKALPSGAHCSRLEHVHLQTITIGCTPRIWLIKGSYIVDHVYPVDRFTLQDHHLRLL